MILKPIDLFCFLITGAQGPMNAGQEFNQNDAVSFLRAFGNHLIYILFLNFLTLRNKIMLNKFVLNFKIHF